jgi:ABC-2 type transport system permease protein
MPSPIADLTYRNYDGPLEPPVFRWWAISRAQMTLSFKKKGLWVWAIASGYWYLFLIIGFYFVDTLVPPNLDVNGKNPVFQQIIWKDQFLNAFSISQLLLFVIALILGAGSIANDNRARALLVYLSKPCSRLDYIIGKWFGIFLPLTVITAAPMAFFYVYCAMTYRSYGFLSDDPTLCLRLVAMCFLPGVFYASVVLGISSLFDQGRLAGATFAGLYFIPLFLTKVMQFAHMASMDQGGTAPKTIDFLFYCSMDGIQIAMAKNFLGTRGSPLFTGLGGPGGPGGRNPMSNMIVPEPSGLLFGALMLGLCALCLWVAWSRVRAVEVVG